MLLLLVGWLDHRDALAVLGFALVVGGAVLPRVHGPFEAGPQGVKGHLDPSGPRTRIRRVDPSDGAAVELEVVTEQPSGEIVSYTESLAPKETIELWGGRVLTSSAGQGDWWVFAEGPGLSERAWEAIFNAPDMRWASRRGATFQWGDSTTDEPDTWSYRFIAKGADREQALKKVHGVLSPYVQLIGWRAGPVTEIETGRRRAEGGM